VNGNIINVYILVPEGITWAPDLMFFIATPKGIDGNPAPDPNLAIDPTSIKIMDLDGNPVSDVNVSLN